MKKGSKASKKNDARKTVNNKRSGPSFENVSVDTSGTINRHYDFLQNRTSITCCAIAICAIGWSLYPFSLDASHSSSLGSLLEVACQPTATNYNYCHAGLVAKGRTMQTRDDGRADHSPTRYHYQEQSVISQNEHLLEIPRDIQIWDIDAMKDPFMRSELLQARHGISGKPVDVEAFLAAHISRIKIFGIDPSTSRSAKSKKVVEYYVQSYLPTHADYLEYRHPVAFFFDERNETEEHQIQQHLLGGPDSFSYYAVTQKRQAEIKSEYEAFCTSSPRFCDDVSYNVYSASRISVISRVFGTAPIEKGDVSEEDFALYSSVPGWHSDKGPSAFVPVIDSMNHHPTENTATIRFHTGRKSLMLSARRDLYANSELFISYGTHSDALLYASYGFVISDGSGPTRASLASYHTLLNEVVFVSAPSQPPTDYQTAQHSDLLEYLRYDDGYSHCIQPNSGDDAETWNWKKLKFEFLAMVANDEDVWAITMPPPNLDEKENQEAFSYAIQTLLSTCRMLALIPSDYNGQGENILSRALRTQKHQLNLQRDNNNDDLEIRAMQWLKRLSQRKYEHILSHHQQAREWDDRESPSIEPSSSWHWSANHVRQGELQTLRKWWDLSKSLLSSFQKSGGAWALIRTDPCPMHLSKPLLSSYAPTTTAMTA